MSFDLYLAGAEVSAHAKTLKAEGWTNVAVSYWALHPRLPKKKQWRVAERLQGCSVLLDSGGAAINKNPPTVGEIEDYATALRYFSDNNCDEIDLIVELDALSLGPRWIQQQREGFYADFGDRFIPVWHVQSGMQELDRLCEHYHRVGIPEDAIEEANGLAMRANALVTRLGTEFHALASAKPDDLRSVRFSTATTGSWLSPTRYGETIFWDGHKLHRYPARLKDQARRRNAAAFTRGGFDADLIAADDNAEITRLTLWSLRQLADSIRPQLAVVADIADKRAELDQGANTEIATTGADSNRPAVRNVPLARDDNDRAVLPVIGFESIPTRDTSPDGSITIGERLVTRLSSDSVRQCDTCFVAASCPAHKTGHACAFNLPVSIETKDQLLAVLKAVVEMQTQRVMFGRFAEELAGGYPDANLSDEIERLFKIVALMRKLEDTNAFLKVSLEARGQSGILSQLFGERAGALRQLPASINADRILDGALNGELDS